MAAGVLSLGGLIVGRVSKLKVERGEVKVDNAMPAATAVGGIYNLVALCAR